MRLEGKTAIVTGAGRGLGKGIAVRLMQEGASVVVSDIIKENAEICAAEINALGGKAIAFFGNIAKQEDVDATYAAAIKAFGKVDIVVNNAGINKDGTLVKMEDTQWDAVISVNLTGTFRMARRIHDVDLYILILNGGVLCQNRDAPLTLQISGVHDAFHDLLVFPIHAALLQHLVHQCRFAVIDVGDDGDIS